MDSAAAKVERTKDRAEDAAGKAADSPVSEGLARAGLVARGFLYVVVGILAVQLATHRTGRRSDARGALQSLSEQPLGKLMLVAVSVGLAGYALWRFLQAVTDSEGKGTDLKGVAVRAGYFCLGVVYVGLLFSAVRLIAGSGQSQQSEQQAMTAGVMKLPLGRWLVAAVGVAVIGAGVYNGYRSVTRKFRRHLKDYKMNEAAEKGVTTAGVIGFMARGVVFALVGVFLVRAAVQFKPDEGVGLDGALKKLAEQGYGPPALLAVAAGLMVFGAFSILAARYAKVLNS